MRYFHPAVLALCVSCLAPSAARAQAVATPADFTAFSIAMTEELPDSHHQPVPLVLESDAAGRTVFSVPGLDALEAVSGGSFGVNDQYWLMLGIVPRPGYVITRYELSGTVSGRFELGTPRPGAINIRYPGGDSDAYFGVVRPFPGNVQIADLQGVETFDITTPAYGVTPGFPYAEVLVWGFIHSNAISSYYDYIDESGSLSPGKSPSAVFLNVSDTRLTVHWELVPVPEPRAWMMIAAGLVPLVVRRKLFDRSAPAAS